MVRPVIFVPYFLQVHCAIEQSSTFTISFDTNQFHLHINFFHHNCSAKPIFTKNFPIVYLFSNIDLSFSKTLFCFLGLGNFSPVGFTCAAIFSNLRYSLSLFSPPLSP